MAEQPAFIICNIVYVIGILQAPNFNKPSSLAIDDSDMGL